MPLACVYDQADRRQKINEVHLTRCKDSTGRDAKLVVTVLALKLAARGDLVCLVVGAFRTNRFAVSLRPAHLAERIVRRRFASFVDAAKAKCA